MVAGRSFSVDIRALLEALTEQFPEPLLCIRELVQNAADAGAKRIAIEVAYDGDRGSFRISVTDDGRGMGPEEVEGYLTIGHSNKDPARHRGRFGIGKLSPYALGISHMIVETSDGSSGHRIEFDAHGAGALRATEAREPGTTVRIYKACERQQAAVLARRTYELVKETCGSLPLRIEVNGRTVAVASDGFETAYARSFESEQVRGRLGVRAEPVQRLTSGHILLETGAPILGEAVSYALDSSLFSPTLSRNAVRRDGAFEAVVREARSRLPELEADVIEALRRRLGVIRRRGVAVERHLDPDDRAAVEWLRTRLFDREPASPWAIARAPVLETADGDLVSLDDLRRVAATEGAIPTSRTPRSADELTAYGDRGVPVLLLYRDVEDFLESEGIRTVEVESHDIGREIAVELYSPGERALLAPDPVHRRSRIGPGLVAATLLALAVGATVGLSAGRLVGSEAPAEPSPLGLGEPSAGPPPTDEPSKAPGRSWPLVVGGGAALLAAAGLAAWGRRRRAFDLPVRETTFRPWRIAWRVLRHPRDFLVARAWLAHSAQARPVPLEGYRELVPEPEVPVGVRLDLDRLSKGLVDLRGPDGGRSDARVLVVRDRRALLNRNHPTVRRLVSLAESEPLRAKILLEALLATDPDLARRADPRQAEWDLVARARARLARAAA